MKNKSKQPNHSRRKFIKNSGAYLASLLATPLLVGGFFEKRALAASDFSSEMPSEFFSEDDYCADGVLMSEVSEVIPSEYLEFMRTSEFASLSPSKKRRLRRLAACDPEAFCDLLDLYL